METTLIEESGVRPLKRSIPGRLAAIHIGPMPVAVYIATAFVAVFSVSTAKLPNDILGGLLILMLAGFLLAKIGENLPVLKQIGGTAILALFVPSALVGYALMPEVAYKAIATTFKTANFQYFFIACLVVGSILGMPRRILIHGFIRMFAPLFVGTVASIAVGLVVGLMFGRDLKDAFFFVIVPIVSGGLAEGILPPFDWLRGNATSSAGRTGRHDGSCRSAWQRRGDHRVRPIGSPQRKAQGPQRRRNADESGKRSRSDELEGA